MNPHRRLAFNFIAIVIIPLLLLGYLEYALSWGGYGYDPRFLKRIRNNGGLILTENPQFTRGFFPPRIAQTQQPIAALFAARKAPRTFRIVVLGESAAAGYPDSDFGFSRILEILLRDQFPGVRFEVINTGIAAMNSHSIRLIAKDLAPWQADLFIVYMGNNEVVGPYGPGTIFAPLVSNLSILRTAHFVKNTRTGQLLADGITRLKGAKQPELKWEGMQMFFDKRVGADDPRLKHVYTHFQANLKDILKITRGTGAQTIVSTVAGNVRGMAPFASRHDPALSANELAQWQAHYRSGIDAQTRGDCPAAVKAYRAAARIDDDFADLHYRLGRCQLALADEAAAKESFIKARDLDTLRFRADTRINEIIRQEALDRERERIYFLDAEKTFEENSAHGISDDAYFYDHVHFNFAGNYLLATAIFDSLRPHLPAWVLETQTESRPLLGQKECEELLAFTGFNRHDAADLLANALMNRPPFTNMVNYEEMIQNKREEESALRYFISPQGMAEAAAAHRLALAKNPDPLIHLSLGRILWRLNEREEALTHMRRAGELMPHPQIKKFIREREAQLNSKVLQDHY